MSEPVSTEPGCLNPDCILRHPHAGPAILSFENVPCKGCQEQGDKLDTVLTAVVTLSTNVADLAGKLENVIGGVNIVGEQNNWIVENAGRVFTAFEEMRAQFSKGGLMGMVKGMKSDDKAS